jgi:predicted DsbA family dithiol-disulfide isomerase
MKDIVQNDRQQVDRVDITFYTDPLDCWSWAFEPQWKRLLYEYGEKIYFRYVMSGLIPSWQNFNDPANSISRPQQMGPLWMEASLTSGMLIDDRIWVKNPPASSFPACIAVKCAELQSKTGGQILLRLLREAVMLRGENISQQQVIMSLAKSLAESNPTLLNLLQFERDLTGDAGLEAFRKDYNEVQSRNITRFPTLILRSATKPAIIMTGYRPYAALLDAVIQIAPGITPSRQVTSIEEYIAHYPNLTDREIQEVIAPLSVLNFVPGN